jgi:SAM-dependent methyltransferase
MNCPLCNGSKTVRRRCIDTSELIPRWNDDFGIDIRGEFGEVTVIELYKCADCQIGFFKPDSLAGSPRIYEELGKREWYYVPHKWEHDVALLDLDGARNGIEIGCGFGSFVDRVRRQKNIPFEGCEQNPSAVQVARSKGVAVLLEDSENLAKRLPSAYDVVCSFQVLEHVTHPRNFLKSLCDLLRPGGKLLIGVPNGNSFLKHRLDLLDLPPHHMTRWTADSMMRIQRLFPLKFVRLAYEPLKEPTVEFYVEGYANFLKKIGLGVFSWPSVRSRMSRLIRRPWVRSMLRGQALYAVYERT